jgi:methionyl-tRNA synthetase
MTNKYFGGVIPAKGETTALEAELAAFAVSTVREFTAAMEECRLADAMEAALALAKRSNKYIDETAPWALAKDGSTREYLGTVLYHLLECIRYLAVLFAPAMPDAARGILLQLRPECDPEAVLEDIWDTLERFGGLAVGTQVTEKPAPLFARLDAEIMT